MFTDKSKIKMGEMEHLLKFNKTIAEIEKICHENDDLVRLQKDKDENVFLHIIDIDPKSDFFFKIISIKKRESGYTMTDFKPVSKISIQKGSRYSDRKYDLDTDTIEAFKNWIQMLKKYNAIEDTISNLYSNNGNKIFIAIIDKKLCGLWQNK